MSPRPYPIFVVSESDNPQQLLDKIRMLIQLYLKDPDQHIADAVVKHIAAILAHHGYIYDVEQRCMLRRLEMHWRCLTWLSTAPNIAKRYKKQSVETPPSIRLQLLMSK